MSENNKRLYANIRRAIILLAVAALVVCEILFRNGTFSKDVYSILTRTIGGAVAIVFMLELGFATVLRPRWGVRTSGGVLFVIFAFVIAINNFPWASYLLAACDLSPTATRLLAFALVCLSTGLFEELIFRGCVFTYILQLKKNKNSGRRGMFMAILWSSVIFGLIHMVNFFGGSPASVILQIGYSALIGALCSLLLLTAKNIWLCVLVHALYNFAGGIVDEMGSGVMWTAAQVALTATVAVAVVAYALWYFFGMMPADSAHHLLSLASEDNTVCKTKE